MGGRGGIIGKIAEGVVAVIAVLITCYARHEHSERRQLQPSHRSELYQEGGLGVVVIITIKTLLLMLSDSYVEFSCNCRLEMKRDVRFAVANTGTGGLIRQHFVACHSEFDGRRRRLVVGIGVGCWRRR